MPLKLKMRSRYWGTLRYRVAHRHFCVCIKFTISFDFMRVANAWIKLSSKNNAIYICFFPAAQTVNVGLNDSLYN